MYKKKLVAAQPTDRAPRTDASFEELNRLFDALFPICRSITGPGIRKSMELLKAHIPWEIRGVPSGTKIFDWEIPEEWSIRDAYVESENGKRICSFQRSNLSVVNYSEPVDRWMTLSELKPHLHTLPDVPRAIPYVTSYYRRNWGFCLPYDIYRSLPDGKYHARIDSEFKKGELNYAEYVLKGESPKEVLLSTYLCHPSLANNELSGPLVAVILYHRLKGWARRHYTYRFYAGPETIGSLAYLHERGEHLKSHLAAGLVLTCLGGPVTSLSYKTTRRENALIDQVVQKLGQDRELDISLRPFTPVHGSDERQYCSPGFDLSVGQIVRTAYKDYEGYHNSLDDKDFMQIRQVMESADKIEHILKTFEHAGCYRNLKPHGEVQLGKRGLYPTVNEQSTLWAHSADTLKDSRLYLERLLTILNYSDGQHSMVWIADRCRCSVMSLAPILEKLEGMGLLMKLE